jgi:outer membrane protein assembly factor BamB
LPTHLALPAAPLSVYIGSTDGSVSALDAASGAVRWHSLIAGSTSTATVAALAEGALYVTVANVNAYPLTTDLAALRAGDGSVLWHASFMGAVTVVATGRGVIYLALESAGTTPHEIQMRRAQDGMVLWRTEVAGAGPLHASAYDGTIYVTSFTSLLPSPGYYYASTVVYALRASTGAVAWHTMIARTNFLAAVADGALYLVDSGTDVVCDPQMLHVLSARDGTERWHRQGSLLRVIGVEQGRAIVAAVPDGCAATSYSQVVLSALNATNGVGMWEIGLQSPYGGSLANGVIYLPVESTALAAYRASDGSGLWQVRGESGRIWVLNQELYTSVAGQGLDALDPATGTVRWRFQSGDGVAVATVANGMLYGTSTHQATDQSLSRAIVALEVRDGKPLWSFPITTLQDSPLVG